MSDDIGSRDSHPEQYTDDELGARIRDWEITIRRGRATQAGLIADAARRGVGHNHGYRNTEAWLGDLLVITRLTGDPTDDLKDRQPEPSGNAQTSTSEPGDPGDPGDH